MTFSRRDGTCCLATLLLWVNASTAFAEDTSAATEGQALFVSHQCWQCHGFEGQGGAAARVGPTRYPFEVFVRFVRQPNLMPAYSPKVLSDEQLRKIYDYLDSMPEPPPLEDIPLLRPESHCPNPASLLWRR